MPDTPRHSRGQELATGQRPMATDLRRWPSSFPEDLAFVPGPGQFKPRCPLPGESDPGQGLHTLPSAPTSWDRKATAGLRVDTVYYRETENWPQRRAPDREAR